MCRPPLLRCRVTAADSNVQSRPAHAPPLVVAYPKWSVHHVAAAPGQAARQGSQPARRPPGPSPNSKQQ